MTADDWVPVSMNGKSTLAIDFDGTDDYIDIPNFTFGAPCTISVWFNFSETDGGVYHLLSRPRIWRVGNASDWMRVRWGSDITFDTNQAVNDGKWHHDCYVISKNGSGAAIDFWLDGRKRGTNSSITWGGSSGNFDKLGAEIGGTDNWKGKIANWRLYDRILSPAEIRTLARYPGIAYEMESTRLIIPTEVAAPSVTLLDFQRGMFRGQHGIHRGMY
jgi:hypothetical protein